MRRPRRVRKRKGGNHLSISARNAEWEEVRAKAERAGLPISRYVKRLVERDLGGDWGFTALAPEEQRELLDGVGEVRALLREEGVPPARAGEPAAPAPAPPKETGKAGAAKPEGPGYESTARCPETS